MIGAGALEVGASGPVDERVFTNHHGVHQRGFPRRPQGVDFVDDAAMDSRPPEFNPAAGKAGKDFHARGFGGGQSDDPVFRQISPVVKRARIAVVARSRDRGGKSQPLTVTEQACGDCFLIRVVFQLLLININSQAGIDGKLLVAPGDLFGLDLQPLPNAARTVLLRNSLFGDVRSNHDFGPVGKAQQVGGTGVIQDPHLNHERGQKEERP